MGIKRRNLLDIVGRRDTGDFIVPIKNEEEKYLIDCLQEAVNLVYAEERMLLSYLGDEMKGLEQAFVFRTGIYLQKILSNSIYSNFDLDSEYNKALGVKKTTDRFPKGIRPDLLLHKRQSHDSNLLAVEFKGNWKTKVHRDFEKLVELTSPNGPFRYQLGVFVLIGLQKPEYNFFKNGMEVNFD